MSNNNTTTSKGNGLKHVDNGNSIEDLEDRLDKKLARLKDQEITKAIQQAVKEMTSPTLTDEQRMKSIETNLVTSQTSIDELTLESIQLSRRIVRLGKTIGGVERDINDIQSDVRDIKTRAVEVRKDLDNLENKNIKTMERKQDNTFKILAIITSSVAAIIAILSWLRS